ncbi:MAG: T9SS type A sorting domain-containing protein [Flavobacterium sp.]|nr:T9SS type A sorting domain-containing protein [Flavobacterium sp.]
MKKFFIYFIFICTSSFTQTNYIKEKCTYYCGRNSGIGDIIKDNSGNLIVVGGLGGNNLFTLYENAAYYSQFTTPNCHKPTITGQTLDGFIAKFDPELNLIWATYFGGSEFDTIYKMAVDTADNIYFSGITKNTNQFATPNTYIDTFNILTVISINGSQIKSNGYLTKFNSSGQLLWTTYLPSISNFLKISNQNEILIGGTKQNDAVDGVNVASSGAFNESFYSYNNANDTDGYILKLDLQGNYLGGTYCGPMTPTNIGFDNSDNVILIGNCSDHTNYNFTSANAYQSTNITPIIVGIISKFSSDLSTRIWSTYYGGDKDDRLRVLKVYDDNIYIASYSKSTNMASANAYQQTPAYFLLSKFNSSGNRLYGTYFGTTSNVPEYDILSKIVIQNDKIYVVGSSSYNDGIATANTYQPTSFANGTNIRDGFFMEFGLDGSKNWGSYFGGTGDDRVNGAVVNNNNEIYLSGTTSSTTGIATLGSLQPNLNIGTGMTASNMFLAKFVPNPLSTSSFTKTNIKLTPNPNNGSFSLQGNANNQENLNLIIFDNLGRTIANAKVNVLENNINQNFNLANVLTSGVYYAKLINDNQVVGTFKLLVK